MNGLSKLKKLNDAQLFTFTHAAHTSLLTLFTDVKPAKFTHVKFTRQCKFTSDQTNRVKSNASSVLTTQS